MYTIKYVAWNRRNGPGRHSDHDPDDVDNDEEEAAPASCCVAVSADPEDESDPLPPRPSADVGCAMGIDAEDMGPRTP
jgi:hypothetical protein